MRDSYSGGQLDSIDVTDWRINKRTRFKDKTLGIDIELVLRTTRNFLMSSGYDAGMKPIVNHTLELPPSSF